MKTKNQEALKMYVRSREDIQSLRKSMDNRLGKKADGSNQKVPERQFSAQDYKNFKEIRKYAKDGELLIEKMLKKLLQSFPVYNEFLKDVKGIGEVGCGWILAEFDIKIATTVSKMWQYAGMNGGEVRGKKRISKKKYKAEMGSIIKEMKNIKTKEIDLIIQTNEMVRGDKLTSGFVSPFNKNLKAYLLGVLAPGFVKTQNDYALEFYYPYKNRLENSEKMTLETKKGGKRIDLMWKDCTKGHRNDAALRKMMKEFLKDVYTNWRKIEGLSVRVPYAEEYLGKIHNENRESKKPMVRGKRKIKEMSQTDK